MRNEYRFSVYIAGSLSGTLYTGVTNNLRRRMWQHKNKQFEGFTANYDVDRLLYWESFDDIRRAIARETQLKRWVRRKKIALIGKITPSWKDLSREWFEDRRGSSTPPAAGGLRSE